MKRDLKYRRRLLWLADFLERLPPERFNYALWVGNSWKGKADLSCGTTACALGWATTIPRLRAQGLRLRQYSCRSVFGEKISKRYVALRGSRLQTENFAANRASLEAAEHVFGLERHESAQLFVPDSVLPYHLDPGASAKQVAGHIRGFVQMQNILLGNSPTKKNRLAQSSVGL